MKGRSRIGQRLMLLFSVVMFGASAAPGFAAAPQPLVRVVRDGGFCRPPGCPPTWLQISETTISGDGYVSRPLKPADRAALLRAIGKLDVAYLRSHPFKGTCPTAYDAQKSTYRFRGFAPAVAECTYDVRGIEAVRLTERLLATLKFARS
jgi:hypothetical protein